MNSLIGSTAAPTFDDPLEMLRACHGRIEAQCVTLTRLGEHLSKQGCDEQAVQAARAILHYFDTAGQHHHQDEERDLFPRLIATHDQTVTALITRLLQEHQRMEAAWNNLRPLLQAIAEDHQTALDKHVAQHFIDVYATHIETENGTLLPLAQTLLNAEQLQAIGRNMASRRGVVI
ncbi:MAG: hemerythrin domain-containing protein [Sideroxydans sp.]|nr:hemerythrin domain-containing protein [Sideroxydans sp.]